MVMQNVSSRWVPAVACLKFLFRLTADSQYSNRDGTAILSQLRVNWQEGTANAPSEPTPVATSTTSSSSRRSTSTLSSSSHQKIIQVQQQDDEEEEDGAGGMEQDSDDEATVTRWDDDHSKENGYTREQVMFTVMRMVVRMGSRGNVAPSNPLRLSHSSSLVLSSRG